MIIDGPLIICKAVQGPMGSWGGQGGQGGGLGGPMGSRGMFLMSPLMIRLCLYTRDPDFWRRREGGRINQRSSRT